MDSSEHYVGQSITKMTAAQLVSYLMHAMEDQHGIDLRVEGAGHKEKAVMAHLQKLYGADNAGLIVQYAVTDRDGLDEKQKRVTFFHFQKERKWWTDQLYTEMQQTRKDRDRKIELTSKAISGFGTISQFLHHHD